MAMVPADPEARVSRARKPGRAEADEVESVSLEGQVIEGEFRSKRYVGSHGSGRFRSIMPQQDDSLLPLLRRHGVAIRVTEDKLEIHDGSAARDPPLRGIAGPLPFAVDARRARERSAAISGPSARVSTSTSGTLSWSAVTPKPS